MRLTRLAACLSLFAFAARAEQENPDIRVNLSGRIYPPLAMQARIYGDVDIQVSAGQSTVIAGHPLLVYAARANLATWTLPPLDGGKYEIHFHFEFIDPSTR